MWGGHRWRAMVGAYIRRHLVSELMPLFIVLMLPVLMSLAHLATDWQAWGYISAHSVNTALVLLTFAVFVRRWANSGGLPARYHYDMSGKNVIVTGGNSGIGLRVAATLAKWGARVTIGCRSIDRATVAIEQMATEIRLEEAQQITFQYLDLSSQRSIHNFVREWRDQRGVDARLDVLVNNAGVMMTSFGMTEEGIEQQFGINHLGHFLLSYLLVEDLKRARGRVVNVSSFAHVLAQSRFDFPYLRAPSIEHYQPLTAYGSSKAATIMHAREFNQRYSMHGVTAYSVYPGFVNTNIYSHSIGWILTTLFQNTFGLVIAKSPQTGADSVIYCAVDAAATPGGYHENCRRAPTGLPMIVDSEACAQLWDESLLMCRLPAPVVVG